MRRIIFLLLIVLFLNWLAVSLLVASPLKIRLQPKYGVSVGDTILISLMIESELELGGIDMNIHYDDTLLSFVEVVQDTGLNNWESFYPAHDTINHLVSVTAIADIPNGPFHPDPEDFYPRGSAARYTFVVQESFSVDSSEIPLTFYWDRCGDNAASNREGNKLKIIHRLFDHNNVLVWDEADNINYPDSIRPDNIGVPDSCLEGTTGIELVIEFRHGVIANYYLCGDANGDSMINISDVVYLITYVFGFGPPPDPLAAGDADCNGMVNVSDIVYLLAYIFGGGDPPCAHCP